MPEAVAASTEVTAPVTTQTASWTESIKDEGLKGALSKFESQDKALDAIGYKAPEPKDWRTDIKDDDAKKFAESSTDINHLVKRAIDMRNKLSNAIVRPGKNATPEDIAAYRKAVGIPEKPDEYEFPELPSDQLTDEIKASREQWSKRFHDLGVPKEVAKSLITAVNDETEKLLVSQIEDDKAFARKQEEALRNEWKGADYDKNKLLANRAFEEIANRAGIKLDVLTKLETNDGRFLMDRAEMVKLFAVIGREMGEGSLGPTLTESQAETLDSEVRTLRQQQAEAQQNGDSKLANRLYQREQALIAKMKGNKPIVGSQGRAA